MIYLCIPAHNEEQTVGVVLWKIRQVLTDFPRDYQILVADDASTDGTAEVLAPYARVLPLTILRARQRRGYAASLEMLLREACRRSPYPKRDAIVVLQADFTDEPEDVVPLIKKIEQGADIVGGTRATNTRPALLERWLVHWQRRVLGRIAWPDDAGDPLSGFRSYRVYTIARAIDNAGNDRLLHWDGAIADAELLQAAAANARRVESIDLVHRPDRRQRPTRASTWETLKRLRRFVRGATPVTTVPLAELSPETLPPPRPLEIERERRSEAVPDRSRNGRGPRNGRSAAGRNGRDDARPARTGPKRAESDRTDRSRRDRPAAQAGSTAEKQERPPRRRNKPAAATGNNGTAPQAGPETAAPGNEATDPAAEAVKRKKRRRRRRRPGSASRAANQNGTAGAEVAGPQPEAVTSSALPAGAPEAGQSAAADSARTGTAGVSQGTTTGSAVDHEAAPGSDDALNGEPRKKRRRRGGRRGGRGRRRKPAAEAGNAANGEIASTGVGATPTGEATGSVEPTTRAVEHVSAGSERIEND